MKSFTSLFSIALAIALVPALAAADDSYQPRNTQAPGEEPPTPAEAAAAITVPEGFQVTLFAGEPDVRQPVAMAIDDRGRLWVAESYSYKEWQKTGEDRILVFEDTDNDGVHDSRKVFASGIDHLSGMTVGWGGVWACSSPNLLFFPDKDRNDVPDGDGKPEVILDGWTTKAGHNFFNGLTWGIDGWLYGRHGITAPSKVGVPGTPDEERIEFDCSIWRYHPVTKKFEVVCRGTTNPWGLDWNAAGDMFFTNNVNGHLWHAIPGAYYPRMGNRADPFSKFVYDRIPMCCDHLHHAGSTNDWTKTRDGKGVHGELGGGHSHCGGMIYLGGKWPEQYRDKMFMCNTHGRRVNVDRLDPEGPTYVARHEDDFLHANNPWFRGVQLLYGPDGDVYLSDWTDLGECHDNDGVHRTSGRIYKIIYGEPSPPMEEKLWEMTDEELLTLHGHDNEWFARMARWILLERLANGETRQEDFTKQYSQHVDSLPNSEDLAKGSQEKNNLHFNRLVMTDNAVNETARPLVFDQPELFDNSQGFQSLYETTKAAGFLKLYLSARIPVEPEELKWQIVQPILRNPITGQSNVLQLLAYYKIKDLAAADAIQSLECLRAASDSCLLFSKNLAQNLAENEVFAPLITMLSRSDNEGVSEAILTGFAAGVSGRKDLTAPKGWPEVFESEFAHPDLRHLALRIQLSFDENDSRARLSQLLASDSSEDQQLALDLLTEIKMPDIEDQLLPLLENNELAAAIIPVLAKINKTPVVEALVAQYPTLPPEAQPLVVNALVGNKKFAAHLLDALETKTIPQHAVTAYHARQIHSLKDDDLKKRLIKTWGRMASSSAEKKAEIKKWQDQLTPDILAKANHSNGETKFTQLCSACHNLHGKGGNIGPELTGANRSDVYYLLENIIDPSATLPQDYRMTIATKKDNSVVTGNIVSENEYTVTLRTLTGEQSLDRKEIKKLETQDISLMPEGLLAPLSPDDIRDLIGYLQ
jgi:putative membrane-bound dehydrogenase-like protein